MLASLRYYWRPQLAVTLGAAVATAVLTGALLVGDSVRGSLRDLVLERLGRIDAAITADGFFRQELAGEIGDRLSGEQTAPLLLLRGSAVHGTTGARASRATILGVDAGFGELYESAGALDFGRREGQLFPSVLLNRALATELGAEVGDPVLLSFQRPSDIPRETLVGREEAAESATAARFSVAAILDDRGPGGFTLAANQSRSLNAFVAVNRLQRVLFGRGTPPRVNALVATGDGAAQRLAEALAGAIKAEDLGFTFRPSGDAVVVESREFVLDAPMAGGVAAAARSLGAETLPVLTYLANSISSGERSVPYSTLSALATTAHEGLGGLRLIDGGPAPTLADDEILLDRWTADDLAAVPGDEIGLSYYHVGARDELSTREFTLTLAGVVAMEDLAIDAALTPPFPGIDEAADIAAWDPPFPVDLDLIRPADEAYWDSYRSAPKAFVAPALGSRLWKTRFGEITSIRVAANGVDAAALEARLRDELARELTPEAAGFRVLPVRAEGLAAAQGATDFAGLFIGLSLFLIAAAAMLVALLFRLGVEQRAPEVGLLLAVGFRGRDVRRRLLGEGVLLAAVGGVLGLLGAVGYAALMLMGLRTWWLPAVGAPVLFLHIEPLTLLLGWLISVLLVVATIWWSVRRLHRIPAPALLRRATEPQGGQRRGRRALLTATIAGTAALALLGTAFATGATQSPALAFGTGFALLVAGLAAFAHWNGGRRKANALGSAAWLGMGARAAGRHRGRSLLSVALVASACFIIVVVAANRGHGEVPVADRASGAGGFDLVAEADVPIHPDLNRTERRADLGFSTEGSAALAETEIIPFRLLPGDDASCLNLYRPERPRVLGVPPDMIERGGFTFQQAAAELDNPWQLLDQELGDGVIPAIGDYNSVRWILHLALGDDLELIDEHGETVRLRLVGLLKKSLFQSELLISEAAFVRHFPGRTGYAYFLADTPADGSKAAAESLEANLARFGFDATPTAEKLAAYQAVENTYLATFQTLGGLGLILGTVGLGIVLLRNVLERRGELATLRAFGFRRRRLAGLILIESAFLLLLGIAIGALAGLVATAPNLLTGSGIPWATVAATLAVVFAVGMLSSLAAVRGTLQIPLLPALKAE